MSWFSLIRAEKSVLDSQEFFQAALTGEFIGEYAVEGIFKKKPAYLRIREAVALFFSDRLSAPLDPLCAKVSQRLLERIVQGKKFPQLFPELFSRFHNISPQVHANQIFTPPIENKKLPSISNLQWLVHHVFDDFLKKEKEALNHWFKVLNDKEKEIESLVRKAIISSLMPASKKAVKAGFHTLIKAGTGNMFDSAWKTGISIAGAGVLYKLALAVFNLTEHASKDSLLHRSFSWLNTHLPSASKALWILTAVHAASMVRIFWKTRHLKIKNTDLNKDQVKAVAVKVAKSPIINALKGTEIYKSLALNEEKIDAFVTLLIHETIDHYWTELHEIRYLNLPLVT